MKLLSIPVLALILAALPLTAAAIDYGPARPMLAAGGGAPQLPSLESGAPSGTPSMGKPDVPDSANPASSTAASAPAPRPHPLTSRRTDKSAHPGKAATPPSQSWQSLLPGSIQ